MILHWPQVSFICLFLLELGFLLAKNGEPRTGKHNFGVTLFSAALVFFLVYKGGFFTR